MIDIKNVTKSFDNFTAIQDISLCVEESSIYGVIGYNGAGKTTLLKTAAGIFEPSKGKVLFDGENTFDNDDIRKRLFYVPDELYFLPGSTVETISSFYNGYYPEFSKDIYNKITNLFELPKDKRINGFSKGMQRQVEIALALASMPKYMLLDECFDGLDPQKRNICKQLFLEYMAESGCSMIMSSHNLSELSDLSDHIGLINGKTLTLDCCVDDISSEYRKFRVIFDHDVNKEMFGNIGFKKLKIEGKMVSGIVHGDIDIIENRIKELSPVFIDSYVLSVEEIFINEMEDKDYEIDKIFEK